MMVQMPPLEIEFERKLDPLATEYTFGPEDQFWAFDFVQSKDGDFVMIAFGACDENQQFSIVQNIFETSVALHAAKEAVRIALEVLVEWQQKLDRSIDLQKEQDWITDTFLKDVEQVVDAWCATRVKSKNRLN